MPPAPLQAIFPPKLKPVGRGRRNFDLPANACSNAGMLGRVRRTTRTDVGLVISFVGVAYLIWTLAIGTSRHLVNQLARSAYLGRLALGSLPVATRALYGAFIDAAAIWDTVGLLWLVLSLVLILGASRQRWSVSWPWMSATCQAMVSVLVTAWAGLSANAPSWPVGGPTSRPLPYPHTGWTFMSLVVSLALVIWAGTLIWLLYEQARLGRGPSPRDSLRTHIPG